MTLLQRVSTRLKKALGQDGKDYRATHECAACTYEVSCIFIDSGPSMAIQMLIFHSLKGNRNSVGNV